MVDTMYIKLGPNDVPYASPDPTPRIIPNYLSSLQGNISDKIITANGLGSAFSFALGIVGTILGEESVQKIKREIIL